MDALLAFLLAGLALVGSPGPATLSLAATGAAFGAARGIAYLVGIVTGMVVVMAVTASGVVGLLLALPGAMPLLTGLAAAYFAYLAWRIATAPPLHGNRAGSRQPAFLAGVALSLINPKGYAAMAALFSGFLLFPERLGLDVAAKMLVLTVLMTATDAAWLVAGGALTRFFRDPRASRAINVTFALLLLASVALTLLV